MPRIGRALLALRWVGLSILVTLGLAVAARGGALGMDSVKTLMASIRADLGMPSLIVLALIYASTLALPFVPGMELGLLLMVVFGPRGVVLVYVASLLGLSLSYAVGRMLPVPRAPPASYGGGSLPPPKADATSSLQTLVSGIRLGRWVPLRLIDWLATHRYLALAISLNLPGNAAIGGGGGIALLCGLSGQYSYRRFLLTIAVAISPLPILILMGSFGPDAARVALQLFGRF
jgi:hypothetical protein